MHKTHFLRAIYVGHKKQTGLLASLPWPFTNKYTFFLLISLCLADRVCSNYWLILLKNYTLAHSSIVKKRGRGHMYNKLC